MKKYALFPIVGFLFLSCYSTTEIELSDDESLLVVNSINFQPDSTWLIEISRSQPYLKNNNFKMIDNAIVSIKDENNVEIPLAATNVNGKILYTSNQKPAYKNKYVLKISAPGFGDVEATSELPEPVSIENISTLSLFFWMRSTSTISSAPKLFAKVTELYFSIFFWMSEMTFFVFSLIVLISASLISISSICFLIGFVIMSEP
ncbi:MAG: DUF4249 family protein, partial [Cytophagia bacterium]|nr:DUF4249 family protein [Cytophagia bacterium]